MSEMSMCPGIGPTKVRRLYETFHEPFRRTLRGVASEREPHGPVTVTTDAVAVIGDDDGEDEMDDHVNVDLD